MRNKLLLLFITLQFLVIKASEKNIITDTIEKIFEKKNIFSTKINQPKNGVSFVRSIKTDTLVSIKMGTINLSDEFDPLLFVEKNIGINVFKFVVPFDGNILLNGFVSAGTNGKMLYSRLINNGKIVSEKTCGIGNPLFNGAFNYQTFVKAGDKLNIQILVHDFKWQLHCCPDLYNCTYIISRN